MGALDAEGNRQPGAKLVGEIGISVEGGDTSVVVHVPQSRLLPEHIERLRELETTASGTRLQLRVVCNDGDPTHMLESALTHDHNVNDAILALGPRFGVIRVLQGKSLEKIAQALSTVIGVTVTAEDVDAFEKKQRAPSMNLFMTWCMVLRAHPAKIM